MPYMVMVAHGWDALTTSLGLDVSARVEPGMPSRWIPVFDTHASACLRLHSDHLVRL